MAQAFEWMPPECLLLQICNSQEGLQILFCLRTLRIPQEELESGASGKSLRSLVLLQPDLLYKSNREEMKSSIQHKQQHKRITEGLLSHQEINGFRKLKKGSKQHILTPNLLNFIQQDRSGLLFTLEHAA